MAVYGGGSYVVYYPRSPDHEQPSRNCPRTPAPPATGTSVAPGSPATTPEHYGNPVPITARPRDPEGVHGACGRGGRGVRKQPWGCPCVTGMPDTDQMDIGAACVPGCMRVENVVSTGMSVCGRRVSIGTYIGDRGRRRGIVAIRHRFFSTSCSSTEPAGGKFARSAFLS